MLIFTRIGARGGYAAPKIRKCPLSGKDLPFSDEFFDRFLQMLASFMHLLPCISVLHLT